MNPKIQRLKNTIEQAISECKDSNLSDVRVHLLRALSEANHIKTKDKNETTPLQKWKFDLSTSSLVNLSMPEKNKILSQIEDMIDNESSKLDSTSKNDLIIENADRKR